MTPSLGDEGQRDRAGGGGEEKETRRPFCHAQTKKNGEGILEAHRGPDHSRTQQSKRELGSTSKKHDSLGHRWEPA